jgi:hypothetical protein
MPSALIRMSGLRNPTGTFSKTREPQLSELAFALVAKALHSSGFTIVIGGKVRNRLAKLHFCVERC